MNRSLMFRIADGLVAACLIFSVMHWGNGWLAAAVCAFGLWNYYDGITSA